MPEQLGSITKARADQLYVVQPTDNDASFGTPTGTVSRGTFDSSTVTLDALAQRVAALIADLQTVGALNVTAAPVNTALPAISGTAAIGQTLSATSGTWTDATSYAYQWKRNGSSIGGATSSTYLLVEADYNAVITVTVTATGDGGSTSATSSGTSTVTGVAPANTVAPVVSGTRRVGQTLTCSTGTWTGTPTPTLAYQWKRYGVAISGATANTYTLVSADADQAITCTVTATNAVAAISVTTVYDTYTVPRTFDWTAAANTSTGVAGQVGTTSVGINGWTPMRSSVWQIQSNKALATSSSSTGYYRDMIYLAARARLNDRVALQGANQSAPLYYVVGLGFDPTTGDGYFVRWVQGTPTVTVSRMISGGAYPATATIALFPTPVVTATYSGGAATDWCVIERTVLGETSTITVTICPDASGVPDYANPRYTFVGYDTYAPLAVPGYAFISSTQSSFNPTIPRFEVTSRSFDITATLRVAPSTTTTIALVGVNTLWDATTVFTASAGLTINNTTIVDTTHATLNVTTGAALADVTITDPNGTVQYVYVRTTVAQDTKQWYTVDRYTKVSKSPYANGNGLATFASGLTNEYGVGFSLDGQYVYALVAAPGNSLKKYNLAGALQATLTYTGINNPRKMLTLPSGDYIVCNYGASNYVLMSAADVYQRVWNTTTTTNTYGMCLVYDQVLGRNTVLTAGWSNNDIKQWELDGTFIKLWASSLGGAIADIAADSVGNVYACDWTNGKLLKFDNTGASLGILTTAISKPHGIAITANDVILAICEDSAYKRLRAYTPAGKDLGDYQAGVAGTGVDVKISPV